MNKTVKVLEKAMGLISRPKDWIQHAAAQVASGEIVRPLDAMACKFCATGAVHRAAQAFSDRVRDRVEQVLQAAVPVAFKRRHVGYIGFNDSPDTTHAKILRLFRRAIKLAQREKSTGRKVKS